MRPALVPALATAVGVVIADQASKRWVVSAFAVGERRPVVGPVSFVRTANRGIAFSLGDGHPLIPWVVTVVVVLATVAVARIVSRPLTHPRHLDRLGGAALGAIVGGGWGNQLDRMFRAPGGVRGPVVDWIDVGPWPVFNVADAALTLAVVALLLGSVGWSAESPPEPSAGPGAGNP